jgi:hypothetical protein
MKNFILSLIPLTLNKLKQEANFLPSSKYSFLLDASIHLGGHLLLSPIRYSNYPPLEVMSRSDGHQMMLPIQRILEATKIYILDLFDFIPETSQRQMIMTLLTYAESSNNNVTRSTREEKDSVSPEKEDDDFLDRFPISIREILLGKNIDNTTKRVEKRHWHNVQTSCLIVLIELIRRYRVVIGMEIIRQRLEQYAVRMWYDESDQDGCTDMGDKGEIIDLCCNAYVEYMEVSSENCCCIGDDAVGFVKRLLQSFWDVDMEKWSTMVDRDGRLVVGMILARYLIQSVKISNPDRSMLSDLITRILLSPNEISGSHVNAVIGYWGLAFFCSLSSELARLVSSTSQKEVYLMKFERRVKFIFTLPVSEVFDRIKMLIVTRLELIQLEREFVSRESMSYLVYSTLPKSFIKSRQRVMNQRVFCLGSLITRVHCGDQLPIHQIKEWFTFVNCLTETYLRVGSFLAGEHWNPELWLLSSTEILSSTTSEEKGLSSFYRLGTAKGWPENINLRAFKDVPIRVMLQSVYTYALAIAMHRALLIHVFDCSHKGTAESKVKSFNLIQFQLAKIYDLSFRSRRHLEYILETSVSLYVVHFVSLFILLYVAFLTILFQDDVATCNHANDLVAFMSNIFCRPSFIPLTVTWDILLSLDDKMRNFDEVMRTITLKKNFMTNSLDVKLESLLQHLLLECSGLLHIINVLRFHERWWEKTYPSLSNLTNDDSVGLSFSSVELIQLFGSLRFKVLWLPICRMFYSSSSFLSGLTALDDPLILRSIADSTRVSILLSMDLIQQVALVMPEDEKQEFVNSLCNVNDISEMRGLTSSQAGLIYEMTKCSIICEDPALSSHMLDLVFILSEGYPYLHQWHHNVTWKYLLENSASQSIVAYDSIFFFPLPRPLVKCVELGLDLNDSMNTTSNRCLINLMRGLKKCFRTNSRYTALYYSLVAHWSHTVYSSQILDLCHDFDKLVNAMKTVLIGDSCKFTPGLRSCKGSRTSNNYIKIEALDKHSIPSFFDLLTQLIVATLSMIKPLIAPQRETLSDKLSINQKSPKETMASFVAVIEVFGRLIDLYGSTSQQFPKTSVQSTVNVCQHSIKLCEDFINSCAVVESSETLQTRKRSSVKSPLQTLIDGIRKNCFDAIKLMCNSFRFENEVRRESMMLSLFERNEKMGDMLFAVESRCNLKPSSLMALPMSNGPKRSKMTALETCDKILDERIVLSKVMKGAKDAAESGYDDDSFEADGDWGVLE